MENMLLVSIFRTSDFQEQITDVKQEIVVFC